MILTVSTIIDIMEEYAPCILKEDYDNVGLMVGDKENEVTKILIALDCSLDVIDEAVETGCNLILTHHPLLFTKPKIITSDTLIGKKIIKLIKNNISVYSSHTNLDSVKGGLNDIATEILGFSKFVIMEPSKVLGCNEEDGIGRVITLEEPMLLINLCEKVKRLYEANYIRYVGEDHKLINTVAIINGSGEDFFGTCKNLQVDCVITGDTKYHGVHEMKEHDIAIIDAGHFITEWMPFKVFCEKLKRNIRASGYSNDIIISGCTEDVYKFK